MTASVNRVLLVGNLGADPEVRYLPSGTPVATLSLATTERRRQADGAAVEQVEWHRVSLYGNLAEQARDLLHKGSQVYVEGRLRTDAWRDRNGNDRKTTVIVAGRMLVLGGTSKPHVPASSEPADMSWLDEAAPRRTPLEDDEIPF
ncbi:single-stranded DNA-binding protein [Thauera aromatica]|nr:single-stranded DNA-binding protein [Thauera aromatica]MCK2126040.1 single-stranded DNA-binding protein [Thauera aromatica]